MSNPLIENNYTIIPKQKSIIKKANIELSLNTKTIFNYDKEYEVNELTCITTLKIIMDISIIKNNNGNFISHKKIKINKKKTVIYDLSKKEEVKAEMKSLNSIIDILQTNLKNNEYIDILYIRYIHANCMKLKNFIDENILNSKTNSLNFDYFQKLNYSTV